MAVIRLLSQHPDPTADFSGQHRCGIHIEKYLRISVAHLLHVLFPHHVHTAFAHGIKDDFNLSKPREHPQEAHNLAFLKIVEQAAGGDQNRSIRHIGADLPDPVPGKGVSGQIGLPLRLRQQYLPDNLKNRKYYQYGDNKTEQAARRYWEEIKK